MSQDIDALFDLRIRSAFHTASLPPAPASLRAALDHLPRQVSPAPPTSRPRWLALTAVAAGLAVVAFVGWAAIFGQGGFGPGVEPTESPSATPSPSPQPASSTYSAYMIGQAVDGRADGSIGGEQIILLGYYSDLRRSPVPCPSLSAAELELGCFDRRQGIMETDASLGELVDGRFELTAQPVVHPYWPSSLSSDPEAERLFDLTAPAAAGTVPPILVTVLGHYDDPRSNDCPPDAEPRCADRFVVDDVISVEDPALATPAPSRTAFPFESPPAPPHWIEGGSCTGSRAANGPTEGDPVDPGFTRAGWITKTEIPYELPFGDEMLPDTVYYVELAGDFPLGDWRDADGDAGSPSPDDFRWWGTATCIAYEEGVITGWLPGTTYRLYRDGHRVEGGDPFDVLPTPTPAP